MPKTQKTIQLKNLARYDVLIEDTSSAYFQVTNLPTTFTGGKNSFLIAGSSYLAVGSEIQIEILDADGQPIYQNPIPKYSEGNSRLVSVEINSSTKPGFATIIILGRASRLLNGNPIPADWQQSYNVRWVKTILVEPNLKNKSQIIFENTPEIFSEESRLYNIGTSSYTNYTSTFTASLTPMLYSGFQIGYMLKAQAPTTFSRDYLNSYITGSLLIDDLSASLYIPITEILNKDTMFSSGHLLQINNTTTVDKLYLYSGSYQTELFGKISNITSSANIVYSKLNTINTNIPISYAKLRLVKLNTVSGEIYKVKVYSKVATNLADYKLVADVQIETSELLVSGSIRGNIPIGDFYLSPVASDNWYSDRLETSSNAIYPISGSSAYYDSASSILNFPLNVSDTVLLNSVKAEIPIYNNLNYDGYVSESGYFIGTTRPVTLFPTTEYTIKLDAIYNKTSGSVDLIGKASNTDIYIIGVGNTKVIDDNPLGQKIGTLAVVPNASVQRYQAKEFNFTPKIAVSGSVGIRLVVSNGIWNFSNISLKPSSDKKFAPDEVELLIPNTEYYNELLQHKVEFFDINNNSTDVVVVSSPTFFTGSNIDLGVLP